MLFPDAKLLSRFPVLPDSLKGKVTMHGTCELSDDEIRAMYIAFQAVDRLLKTIPSPSSDISLNIMAYDVDEMRINLKYFNNDGICFGAYFQCIFLPVGMWRKNRYSCESILLAILEELSHAVWCINDESKVKDYVDKLLAEIDGNLDRKSMLRKLCWESLAAGFRVSNDSPFENPQ